ncbi:hypothetical protein DH2020_003807 [Rehmannia glutinosa]|uniref:WRKY domain-containing protein n=1 Tax=Rehmannia glutinosa TaxID=99300 RepID=A0ABR0XN19_REHGL
MDNNYPPMFQSSSTFSQNSHLSQLNMVMMNSHHAHDHEFIQDDDDHHHKITNNIDEYIITTMENNNSPILDNHEEKKGKKKDDKKCRYAFQTRSQVDILDDGYRWRKYGQKAVNNNNFPRKVPISMHVLFELNKNTKEMSKDEGIVVTTYEGMHSHPTQKSTDNFEHILTQMQIYNSL